MLSLSLCGQLSFSFQLSFDVFYYDVLTNVIDIIHTSSSTYRLPAASVWSDCLSVFIRVNFVVNNDNNFPIFRIVSTASDIRRGYRERVHYREASLIYIDSTSGRT